VQARSNSTRTRGKSVFFQLLGATPSRWRPGHTRVHFRWFRSRRLEFDAVDSGDLQFTTTVPKSFASFLRLIFRPFSAIELSRSFGS
jgi:hypothetical protein